jgi:quercetin dioxygenase-like cupin family protein
VKQFDLSALTEHPVGAFGSVGFSVSRLAAGENAVVTILRVAAGGVIGTHPAPVDQLLVVLDGSGEVRAGDGPWEPIGPGRAVLWAAGEEHTTRSALGLTAVTVESENLCNKPAN